MNEILALFRSDWTQIFKDQKESRGARNWKMCQFLTVAYYGFFACPFGLLHCLAATRKMQPKCWFECKSTGCFSPANISAHFQKFIFSVIFRKSWEGLQMPYLPANGLFVLVDDLLQLPQCLWIGHITEGKHSKSTITGVDLCLYIFWQLLLWCLFKGPRLHRQPWQRELPMTADPHRRRERPRPVSW